MVCANRGTLTPCFQRRCFRSEGGNQFVPCRCGLLFGCLCILNGVMRSRMARFAGRCFASSRRGASRIAQRIVKPRFKL